MRKVAPSTEPVVENDQQEPHWPWFLMGVTAPLVTQSTVVGRAEASRVSVETDAGFAAAPRKPPT